MWRACGPSILAQSGSATYTLRRILVVFDLHRSIAEFYTSASGTSNHDSGTSSYAFVTSRETRCDRGGVFGACCASWGSIRELVFFCTQIRHLSSIEVPPNGLQ